MFADQKSLATAIALTISSIFVSPVQAQLFPAEIDVLDLNGTNGIRLYSNARDGLFGISVRSAGDFNGDGIDDLVIGASKATWDIGSQTGRSYVLFGSANEFENPFNVDNWGDDRNMKLIGERTFAGYSYFGRSVSTAGDINGDGIDDLIIGAFGMSPNGVQSGRSYVIFGSDNSLPSTFLLYNLDGTNGFALNGEALVDQSGRSVSAAGDINGDGIGDLIVGAHLADPNGDASGRSYVVFGSTTDFPHPLELNSLNGSNGMFLNGESTGNASGYSVSSVGDINDDGIDDLIIGAPYVDAQDNLSGRSYLIYGSNTGLPHPFELSDLDGSNGVILNGGGRHDRSGFSASAAGDFNGDGIDDLIIGTSGGSLSGLPQAGRAYVVFGSAAGLPRPFELSGLNGLNGIVLNGESANDFFGSSVSAAGDINGDGIDDLIIGAPHAKNPNGSKSGRSYVVFGSNTGIPSPFELSDLNGQNGFVLNGQAEGDLFGYAVSAAGDINADGVDDLIIGAPGGRSGWGRSYIVFGRATDMSITNTNGAAFLKTGEPTTWTIEVKNMRASSVSGATLTNPIPTNVTSASWICTGFNDAVCANSSGSGGINEPVNLPANSSLLYELTAKVTAQEPDSVSNTATIIVAAGQVDLNPANNSATDTDPVGLFIDGFEDER